MLPSNTHDIGLVEMSAKSNGVRGGQLRSLGAGLYNTLSLFNHSCVPCMVSDVPSSHDDFKQKFEFKSWMANLIANKWCHIEVMIQ